MSQKRMQRRNRKASEDRSASATALIPIILCILYLANLILSPDPSIALATEKILTSLGTRNTTALVLPDESTNILQPSFKNCQNGGSDILALFMIISAPEKRALRDVIRLRSTYMERIFDSKPDLVKTRKKLKLLFFMGLSNTTSLATIEQEWRENDDIVLDSMTDVYLNLTLKTLRMLKWTQANCREAQFLIKLDDDVHLNAHRFLEFLAQKMIEKDSHRLIAGRRYDHKVVVTDPYSKWFTPAFLWPEGIFPNYVSGVFYVLGREAAAKVYKESLRTPLFHLEDVFLVGMVANKGLGMSITHIPMIKIFWLIKDNYFTYSCPFQRFFAVHGLGYKEMSCFNAFNKPGFSCLNFMPLCYHCAHLGELCS